MERKRFNYNVFALDFLYVGVVFVFLTILLLGSGSFKEPDESGHLSNPRHDVMDLK